MLSVHEDRALCEGLPLKNPPLGRQAGGRGEIAALGGGNHHPATCSPLKEVEKGGGSGRQSALRPARPSVPPEDTHSSGIRCFLCSEFGHRRRDYPKLSRAAQHPNGQGLTSRSPVSNQQ
jgi:hypothetical protein